MGLAKGSRLWPQICLKQRNALPSKSVGWGPKVFLGAITSASHSKTISYLKSKVQSLYPSILIPINLFKFSFSLFIFIHHVFQPSWIIFPTLYEKRLPFALPGMPSPFSPHFLLPLRNPIHLIHSLSHSTNISYVSTKCQTVQRQKYRGDQESQGPLKSLS